MISKLFAIVLITVSSVSFMGGIYAKKYFSTYLNTAPAHPSQPSSIASIPTITPKAASTSKETDVSRPDLAAAIEKIVTESQPLKRSRILTRFINACDSKDLLVSAITIVENTLNPEDQTEFLIKLLPPLAEVDPKRASECIPKIKATLLRADMAKVIAMSWIDLDPNQAIEWMQQLSSGFLKNDMFKSVLETLAKSNIQTALNALEKLDPERKNHNLIPPVYSKWAEQDPLAVIQSLSVIPYSHQTLKDVWIIALTKGVEKDPAAAAQLTLSNQNDFFEYFMNQWVEKDPEKAFAWSQGLGDDHARNLAISIYVGVLSKSEPEKAIQTVEMISDLGIKRASNYRLLSSWFLRNPQAATPWILKSSLTEKEKQKILKPRSSFRSLSDPQSLR